MTSGVGWVTIGQKCSYCGQWRSPHDLQEIGNGGVRMCTPCKIKSNKALEMVTAETAEKHCQECRTPLHGRAALLFKDNVYQLLCRRCADSFCAKVDNYRKTRWGWMKKIWSGNR